MTFAKSRALLALALGSSALAACGGSGNGVASASNPPPATYTKIADMTGNRTFQTAGVTYDVATSGFSNGTSNAFGSGATVSYNAAADSYTITAPGGATQTFGPADLQPPNPATPTSIQYAKVNGNTRDQLSLIAPTAGNGVPLSYTVIGTWGTINLANNTSTFRVAIGGAPTLTSDVPKTGSATYSIGVGGAANWQGTAYTLSGHSSGTFSANFGAATVATTLNLAGISGNGPVQNLVTLNGTGSLSSGGPGFTGTLSGPSTTGIFTGLFLGPQAVEMGYGYVFNGTLNGGTLSGAGAASGIKQ